MNENERLVGSPTRRALALDLDGVLVDGMPFHVEAWRRALGRLGIRVPDRRLYELEGLPTPATAAILANELNVRFTEVEMLQVVQEKREVYAEIFRVVPIPGSEQFFTLARQHNYAVAIVTGSTGLSVSRVLRTMGAEDLVDVVVTGEDTPVGKPAPLPYVTAVEELRVRPSNCLVVENAPAGVRSASLAGLSCLGIATYLPASALSEATIVLPTVEDAVKWLASEAGSSRGLGPWLL